MNHETATALDPQAKAVIDLVIKSGRPPYHQLSPKDARQMCRDTRPASPPPAPEIGTVKDLTADGPAGTIPARLYRPKGVPASTMLPALVFFHGGGWVIGDIETHDVLCRQLTAGAGISVVNIDYRLAPEHKFPAALDDAWAATRWVAAHAAALGIDAGRLAVGGDSAGGNLAAVVALLARDHGAPSLALQVLVYPVTDVGAESQSYADFAEGFMLTRDSMRWFIAHYLTGKPDAVDWRLSPLRAPSLARVAPALVVTAGFDPLRDEGDAYARKLREAGVRVDAICYGGVIHGVLPGGGGLRNPHPPAPPQPPAPPPRPSPPAGGGSPRPHAAHCTPAGRRAPPVERTASAHPRPPASARATGTPPSRGAGAGRTPGQCWVDAAARLVLLALLGTGPNADLLAHVFGLLAGGAVGLLGALTVRWMPPASVQWLLVAAAAAAVYAAWRLAF